MDRQDSIKILSEVLGLLRITKKYVLERNKTTKPAILEAERILITLALTVYNVEQIVMPKSMVSDLVWFNGDQTKFKDWWRGIQLFLKSNRVTATNNKITVVLAQLRGGIIGIYI